MVNKQKTDIRYFCKTCGLKSGIHHYKPASGCVNCGRKLQQVQLSELQLLEREAKGVATAAETAVASNAQ